MFDIDAILEAQKEQTTAEFELSELELPDGMETPVLVIKVSRDIRTRAKAAKKRHSNIQGGFEDGKATWKPVDEPEKYLESVLEFCFDRVEGLFTGDPPKAKQKKAFILLATDKEKTAKYIAGLLMRYFDGESLEEPEKN